MHMAILERDECQSQVVKLTKLLDDMAEKRQGDMELMARKHEEHMEFMVRKHEEDMESAKADVAAQCNAHFMPYLEEKQAELDKWDAVFQLISNKAQDENCATAQSALSLLSSCIQVVSVTPVPAACNETGE